MLDSLDTRTLHILTTRHLMTPLQLLTISDDDFIHQTNLPLSTLKHLQAEICSKHSTPLKTFNAQLSTKPLLIPTFSPLFNNLLNGGLSNFIYELFGDSAVGKTTFCHCLTHHVAQLHSVIYVDTGASFSSQRIMQIDQQRRKNNELQKIQGKKDQNPFQILAAIRITKCHTIEQLNEFLVQLTLMLQGSNQQISFVSPVRLVIIDNFASIINPILSRMDRGHELMCSVVNQLKKLSAMYNFAVILANSTVANIQENQTQNYHSNHSSYSSTNQTKAALGLTFTHLSECRIHMRSTNVSSSGNDEFTVNASNTNLRRHVELRIEKSPFDVFETGRSIKLNMTPNEFYDLPN